MNYTKESLNRFNKRYKGFHQKQCIAAYLEGSLITYITIMDIFIEAKQKEWKDQAEFIDKELDKLKIEISAL